MGDQDIRAEVTPSPSLPERVRGKQLHHLALILGIIIAVGPMSVDMYLPAFGLIAREFQDQSVPQLTLASYFIGFAVGQMTYGPLSDRAGRRLPLTWGLTLYTVASIGCALSPGPATLCVCRGLAAFGAAASVVVPRTMVRDLTTGTAAARFFSQIMLVMGIAPVIAPAFGSLVLLAAGWRMIFVVTALYGVICLILVHRFVPETLPSAHRLPIGLGVLIRRYGLILRERGFVSHALIGCFAMSALFTYLAGSPVLFMSDYGFGPVGYAMILAVNSAAWVFFYRLNAQLVGRWGIVHAINLNVDVLLAGTVSLVLLTWFSSPWVAPVFLSLLACGAGFSCIPANAQAGALARHQAHAGSATALMSTMQYCSGAVAGALVGWFADGTGRPMALIMLVSALGAWIAARLRPRTTAVTL